jgi:hypothetical protein
MNSRASLGLNSMHISGAVQLVRGNCVPVRWFDRHCFIQKLAPLTKDEMASLGFGTIGRTQSPNERTFWI